MPDEKVQEVFYEREQDKNGDIHCIPPSDIIEHELDTQCQCQPFWDEVNKIEFSRGEARCRVYVHRRLAACLN